MKERKELETLINAYLDGSISHDGMASLNELLSGDESARHEFSEWLNLDSAMAACAAGWEAPEQKAGSARVKRMSRFPSGMLKLAASIAVLLGIAFWTVSMRQSGYATVEKVVGVAELQEGETLQGDAHEIAAGAIELRTARGARIVIEAPASFRFVNGQRLDLTRGRLAADVPPAAKGFTVVTPDGDAVDLGTKFGVDVPDSGTSEIHVFEGEVIARRGGAKAGGKSLLGGDAVQLGKEARELRSAAFIHPDEMPSLTAGLTAGQRESSDEILQKLREDSEVIGVVDFESSEPTGDYRMVQGRWPGSRAPEFVNVGDRMELDLGTGQVFDKLTLAAWVRLDRLGAPYQSLLHTDGWSESNPGQVHWMITGNTTMRLALRGNTLAPDAEEAHGYPDSSIPVLPERGRWVHLATVYDSEEKRVRFYLNGTFDKETRQKTAHPARLGSMQIGNWDTRDRKLSGRIDEIILMGRAFSDEEIRELYEAGNPYR